MTTAVLGSEGQLGAELVRQLGRDSLPLNRSQCDIGDFAATREALHLHRPTAVINTAAYTKVDLAEQNQQECWHLNAQAVANLAEICLELDIPLVQISTDYVFAGEANRRKPFKEDDAPNPQGVYARSKLAGEQAAAIWEKSLIVRTCGLYGPRSKPTQSNFVDTMLRLGRERDVLRVVNDQHCTPSYVKDVAAAILYLLYRRQTGVFHVVNAGATTWYDFARQIFHLTGLPVQVQPISTAEYGAPAPRPAYSVLDTSKYASVGGPKLRRWQEALADYVLSR